MTDEQIIKVAQDIINPTELHDPKDLIVNSKLIPVEKGIYGWYFDKHGPRLDDGHFTKDAYTLLYVGISGRYHNKTGSLKRRIRNQHLGQNTTAQSTLRRSLGTLLRWDLKLKKQIRYKKAKTPKYWFGEDGEKRLRDWMIEHCRLVWQTCEEPREVELYLMGYYFNKLPLNIEGLPDNMLAGWVDLRREKVN